MQKITPDTISPAVPASATHAVCLSETLDIGMLEPLYRQLEEALAAKQSTLVLKGEQVNRVDAAGLQLLAVFCREARTQGYSVRWQNPSGALRRAAQWTGLSDWLELEAAV
ncbi:MAG: STAS domain-containing protein [Gammaproteobacteria bacterium]|nr:STAS domain-containing protein [Gammaproteobacteria bacterium]